MCVLPPSSLSSTQISGGAEAEQASRQGRREEDEEKGGRGRAGLGKEAVSYSGTKERTGECAARSPAQCRS